MSRDKRRKIETPFVDETKGPSGFEVLVEPGAEHYEDPLNLKRANRALGKEAAEMSNACRRKGEALGSHRRLAHLHQGHLGSMRRQTIYSGDVRRSCTSKAVCSC